MGTELKEDRRTLCLLPVEAVWSCGLYGSVTVYQTEHAFSPRFTQCLHFLCSEGGPVEVIGSGLTCGFIHG